MNLKTQASEETKRNIVETAITILGTEGYPALTVGKLSRRAGISKGALYHHFDSLDELRLTALEALIDRIVVIKEPEQFDSLSAFLEDLGNDHFDSLETNTTAMKALFAFMAQGLFDEGARCQLRHLTESTIEQCAMLFRHFNPELSEEQLESIMSIMDAFFIGMISPWFLEHDDAQCRASWAVLSEMIIQHTDAQKQAGR